MLSAINPFYKDKPINQDETPKSTWGQFIKDSLTKNPITSSLQDIATQTTASALNEVEKTLNNLLVNLPSLLIQGGKLALYKELLPKFMQCIHSSALYCQSIESSHGEEVYFGKAKENLETLHQELSSLYRKPDVSEKELEEAFAKGIEVLKETNVHMLGKGLRPEAKQTGPSFLDVPTQEEKLAPTPPSLSLDEKRANAQKLFIENRSRLVVNLQRTLKVYAAFRALGKEAPSLAPFYQDGEVNEKTFTSRVFKQVKKESKETSCFLRWIQRSKAFLSYKLTGYILGPLVRVITSYGHEEVKQQIDQLHKESKIAIFRTFLLDSAQSLLILFNSSYREVMETKKLPCKPMDQLVLEACNRSTDLHLGRTEEEFNTLFLQTFLTKIFDSSILAEGLMQYIDATTLIRQGFDLLEGAKYDEQGFSHALNLSLIKVLTQLKETLQAPQDASESQEKLSHRQREKITHIFKTLFTSIRLANCSNPEEVRSTLKQPNLFSQFLDATINEHVLLPVAEAGATSILEAIGKMLQPDFLQDSLNDALTIVNDSFLPQQEISHAQKLDTQNRVSALCLSVLDIAIENALKNLSLLNPDLESGAANQAISELRQNTKIFLDQYSALIEEGQLKQADHLRDSFILGRRRKEEAMREDSRIGSSIQKEIRTLYGKVATSILSLNSQAPQEELREALERAQETASLLLNFPSYEFAGDNLYEFARHLVKNQAIYILKGRVEGLINCLQKPAILRCGIQLLLMKPFLEQNGIKEP